MILAAAKPLHRYKKDGQMVSHLSVFLLFEKKFEIIVIQNFISSVRPIRNVKQPHMRRVNDL